MDNQSGGLMDPIKEVNLNNIGEVTPDELLDFMHYMYDDVILCKEQGLDADDLSTMQGFIGWCQNIESYLTPLICKVDIMSRQCPHSKAADSEYQQIMAKKFILNQYYTHIERLYKTISRQCSMFSSSLEMQMDRRYTNMAYPSYPSQVS